VRHGYASLDNYIGHKRLQAALCQIIRGLDFAARVRAVKASGLRVPLHSLP